MWHLFSKGTSCILANNHFNNLSISLCRKLCQYSVPRISFSFLSSLTNKFKYSWLMIHETVRNLNVRHIIYQIESTSMRSGSITWILGCTRGVVKLRLRRTTRILGCAWGATKSRLRRITWIQMRSGAQPNCAWGACDLTNCSTTSLTHCHPTSPLLYYYRYITPLQIYNHFTNVMTFSTTPLHNHHYYDLPNLLSILVSIF